eukprot:jgi/Tetstr1/466084/TSEL_010669.t1
MPPLLVGVATLASGRRHVAASAGVAPQDGAGSEEGQVDRAKGAIMRMLGRQPASAAQIRRKLADKGHERANVDAGLARLQELGLQSDREYAEVFARSKWRQSCWAPARIATELRRNGVCQDDVTHALETVFGCDSHDLSFANGGEEGTEEGAEGGEAPSHADTLLAAAQRQARQYRGLPREAQRRRLAGWLQRRGHSWATVRGLLERLGL